MKKAIVLIVILVIIAGCQEPQQHTTTMAQMKIIEQWCNGANQRMNVLFGRTEILKALISDPNGIGSRLDRLEAVVRPD